jgi:hypothetical protein
MENLRGRIVAMVKREKATKAKSLRWARKLLYLHGLVFEKCAGAIYVVDKKR